MDSEAAERAGGGRAWAAAFVLLVAVAVAFWGVGRAQFIGIDDWMVFQSPRVQGGLTPGNVAWAATRRWSGLWMPLTFWSWQFDATLGGFLHDALATPGLTPDSMPDATVYHIDNLLLHGAASVILFLLLRRATGGIWPSFLVALVWAVHPLRVESVAWVTERKDVLSGLWGFLAIYCYVLWREKKHRGWYWAVVGAMGLSLLAKPTFVTLPFVLVLLDFWPLGRIGRLRDVGSMLLEKWPLLIMTLLRGLLTGWLTRRVEGLPISFGQQIGNALVSYVRYLWIHVKIDTLAVFYPYRPLSAGAVAGAAGLLAAVTVACLWQRARRPWLLMGWLWYLGAMVPMIGFRQIFTQAYADRFTYFPSIGLLVMVFFSVPASWYAQRGKLVAVLSATALVTVVLIAFTIRQVGYWRDSVTLLERTRDLVGPTEVVLDGLGAGYLHVGRIDDARRDYADLIALNPKNAAGHVGLATAYLRMKQPDLALPEAREATVLSPELADAHAKYAEALSLLGNEEEAMKELDVAIGLIPDDPAAQHDLQTKRDAVARK